MTQRTRDGLTSVITCNIDDESLTVEADMRNTTKDANDSFFNTLTDDSDDIALGSGLMYTDERMDDRISVNGVIQSDISGISGEQIVNMVAIKSSDFDAIVTASNTIYAIQDSTVWSTIGGKFVEYNSSDFSIVRSSASTPGIQPNGIGGSDEVIWYSDFNTLLNYEISPTDFSTVRSVSVPTANPQGIGGKASVIWYLNEPSISASVYELDTSDFSIIRKGSKATASNKSFDVGGDVCVILYAEEIDNQTWYVVDAADFSIDVSRSATADFGTNPHGCGGTKNAMWTSEKDSGTLIQLDPNNSLATVKSVIDAAGGADFIGGD